MVPGEHRVPVDRDAMYVRDAQCRNGRGGLGAIIGVRWSAVWPARARARCCVGSAPMRRRLSTRTTSPRQCRSSSRLDSSRVGSPPALTSWWPPRSAGGCPMAGHIACWPTVECCCCSTDWTRCAHASVGTSKNGWTSISATYPKTRCVVTARPSVVAEQWWVDQRFQRFDLLPMSRHSIEQYVRGWHVVRANQLDTPPEMRKELPICEQELLGILANRPTLRGMSANPLLCGLLCALHLERSGDLPESRKQVYEAALDLLMVRWPRLRRRTEQRGTAAHIAGSVPDTGIDLRLTAEELVKLAPAAGVLDGYQPPARATARGRVAASGIMHDRLARRRGPGTGVALLRPSERSVARATGRLA